VFPWRLISLNLFQNNLKWDQFSEVQMSSWVGRWLDRWMDIWNKCGKIEPFIPGVYLSSRKSYWQWRHTWVTSLPLAIQHLKLTPQARGVAQAVELLLRSTKPWVQTHILPKRKERQKERKKKKKTKNTQNLISLQSWVMFYRVWVLSQTWA
jgi:hypothetical protein